MPNHNTWLKLCFLVATNQDPDMSFYFDNQSSKEAMQLSDSAETETNIFASDFDSAEETSRETVSEKYNEEEKEKEGEEQRIRSEKEVIVEKETPVVIQRMHSAETRSAATADTRKRSSNTFSPVDENQSPITDPGHPCKRRPISLDSQTYEESLHVADDSGIDVETLADHVRKLRKKGLRQEYLNIRSESPTGTFFVSK